MKSLKYFSFLLFGLSLPALAEEVPETGPLFDGDEEVVYFFSYHCAQCFDAHSYLSMWSSMQEKDIRRVPLLGENGEWEFGARLFFLLSYAKDKFPLSEFEREKAAYQIVLNMDEYPESSSEYMSLLRDYGLEFESTEFLAWWRNSELMLASTEEIISTENLSQVTPPTLRVYANEKVSWISYPSLSIEPGFEMLKILNSEL
jgi:hypothetical protein